MIALIAALGSDRVIGLNGAMPWHVPADLKRFKRRTVGKPIIMGRVTFESIGRPLPKRRNLVLSRRTGWAPQGVEVVGSVAAAWAATEADGEVMVIGGAAVYAATLPHADRLYLTLIHGAFSGDTFFPALGTGWRVAQEAHFAADDRNLAHTEYVLERGEGPWPEALAGWL